MKVTDYYLNPKMLTELFNQKINSGLRISFDDCGNVRFSTYGDITNWVVPCRRYVSEERKKYHIEFIHTKRKTTAIVMNSTKTLAAIGRSKCHRDDNCNNEIGEAIAVCRAVNGKDCDYRKLIGLE